jgi:hypothetical protein
MLRQMGGGRERRVRREQEQQQEVISRDVWLRKRKRTRHERDRREALGGNWRAGWESVSFLSSFSRPVFWITGRREGKGVRRQVGAWIGGRKVF